MDTALNEKGKRQACAIAARLAKDEQLTPSVIISSDLSRLGERVVDLGVCHCDGWPALLLLSCV